MESNFKLSKKIIHSDSRSSIIEKDNEKMKEILSEEQKLNYYKKQLLKCDSDETKSKLQAKIDKIERKEELVDYLMDLGDFLLQNKEEFTDEPSENNNGILKFVDCKKVGKDKEMYDSYVNNCIIKKHARYKNNTTSCVNCQGDVLINTSEAVTVCSDCGFINKHIDHKQSTEWNFTETCEIFKPYSYKRSNHFKEWISQIQGREGTKIPDEVIELIKSEIKKEKIIDRDKITFEKTKEFLKKLKLNKYYEHIPIIIHKLTGNKQLFISHVLESKLIDMFDKIQEPFIKHCPSNRKNFLSYSYTLYKFFQILELNEYLVYFPLLKSREKLFEQEQIWKNICKELNWKFINCI